MKTIAAALVVLTLATGHFVAHAGVGLTIENVRKDIRHVELTIEAYEKQRVAAWKQMQAQRRARGDAVDTPPPLRDEWLVRFTTIQSTLSKAGTRVDQAKHFLREERAKNERAVALSDADTEIVHARDELDELGLEMTRWSKPSKSK